ncbi:MAG: AraC family transcriptional regulator ligand-binding domain-containing protein [Parvibaculum sp.]|uniref:AraC family transcriptional regulator n=1 Tax=Parvibaculum sp. TaxID=2024848 RepID=UPI0028515B47|nr:AraC family transcriptional regulator ligand-binding domain-containing protein [Parvibaculum sp.]MDR3498614.1 AraC family transcriptional regulator ligand-binding domain-containing protein [Parvibaculum sp.]
MRGSNVRQAAGANGLTWGATFDRAIGFAVELGLQPDAFFDTKREAVRPRRNGSRVPLDLLARFLSWAAEASGDDSFGLKLGARFHPSDLGAYGYLLLNSPTLGESMALAQRFAEFQQQGNAFVWKGTSDGFVEVRYDAHGLAEPLRRQDAECTLAIAHAIVQRLSGRPVRPVEIRVQHGGGKRRLRLEDHFGCPALYHDRHNALRYEASILALPIRGADPKLRSILAQYVEQELEGLPPPDDEIGRVRWAIRRSLATGRSGIAVVARQCGIGERSLQRRLAGAGLSYSDLVDAVRQDIYAELTKTGKRSLREAAELLGFSDASAFAKARRRWERGA